MYSCFKTRFLRVAFLGLFLSFLSGSAFADVKAALDFSRAFIQSRIEFKKDLARYFSDPHTAEDEKSEIFSDLMGDDLVQFLTPALAAQATLLTVDRYEDVLRVVFSDETEGWIQEFERLADIKADRDMIRLQRLQVHLWMLKKDEYLLRKTLRKKALSETSDARMVELDTIETLMAINSPLLPDGFFEFLNQYVHVQPNPRVVQGFLTRPALQKQHQNVLSIFESLLDLEQLNVPTNAKAVDKITFSKYKENWVSPMHEDYRAIMSLQKKVQSDVKSTTFNTDPSEAENRAASFLIYDFGFLTYKFLKEYNSLLFEMRDQSDLLNPYRIRKKKSGKNGKSSASKGSKGNRGKQKKPRAHSKPGVKPETTKAVLETEGEASALHLAPVKKGDAVSGQVTEEAPQIYPELMAESSSEGQEAMVELQMKNQPALSPAGLDPLIDLVTPAEGKTQEEFRRELRIEDEAPVSVEAKTATKENSLPPEVRIYSRHFYLTSDYKKQVGGKLSAEELAEIKQKFTGGHYEKDFRLFFDDRNNHLSLSFKDIKGLVERIGGKIYKSGSGSSHRTVVIPGGVAHSWKPGKRGKRKTETKLPRKCVQLYRKAFEDAGITPENILN